MAVVVMAVEVMAVEVVAVVVMAEWTIAGTAYAKGVPPTVFGAHVMFAYFVRRDPLKLLIAVGQALCGARKVSSDAASQPRN